MIFKSKKMREMVFFTHENNKIYLGVLFGVFPGELAGVYLWLVLPFSVDGGVVVMTGDLQLPCLSALPGLFSLFECGWRPFLVPSLSLADRKSDSLSDAADDNCGESLACRDQNGKDP